MLLISFGAYFKKKDVKEDKIIVRKIHVFIIAFLISLLTSYVGIYSQQNKGVLKPENANEARLNRLQPPEKVMDAIGEWLNATSPDQIEAQMKSAGYKLERTETFLKVNNLYIYIFRVKE